MGKEKTKHKNMSILGKRRKGKTRQKKRREVLNREEKTKVEKKLI